MLSLVFGILMIWIFGKMIGLAVKAAWGLTKILVNLVLLPVILIGLVVAGLLSIALPLLLIVGAVVLFGKVLD